MLAVIRTGGKQYLVSPGNKIKVEKLDVKEGKEINFDQVLLLAKGPSTGSGQVKIKIGTPLIKGAKVRAKVLEQGKAKKVIVFKYRAKKRYQKKMGHRQPYSQVEILKILFPSQKSAS